jgi:hypothetical protein
VVLVGAGARARAWWGCLAARTDARVVGLVARGEATLPGLDAPRFSDLDGALAAFPGAAVAAALPPRLGLTCALRLAGAGRRGLVESPLAWALGECALGEGARAVQVANGWVTLRGWATVLELLGADGGVSVDLQVHGLPEEAGGDREEVLVHALAVARRLLIAPHLRQARLESESSLSLVLAGQGPVAELRLRSAVHGHGLRLVARGASGEVVWQWSSGEEVIEIRGRRGPERRSVRAPTAEARALAQLLTPGATGGDDLGDAADGLRLGLEVCYNVGRRPVPTARAFAQAVRLAAARPADLLARLGLRGPNPPQGPVPRRFGLDLGPVPLEAWALRAGLKKVAFVTVPPERVAATLGHFPGAHAERRERRVQVGPQDAWDDRRGEGEPRVELYLSQDPALARRAAELQASGDPSGSLSEMGDLLGYPRCCVEAFAAQDDRSNNTRNRYATFARTLGEGPWPWELNNLFAMLAPFFPCSYECPAALAWVRALLLAMGREPSEAARAHLAQPVLYFEHGLLIVLEGEARAGQARHAGVLLPREAPPEIEPLAGALGAGSALTFDEAALCVRRGGVEIWRAERVDPGLGFLAPFG